MSREFGLANQYPPYPAQAQNRFQQDWNVNSPGRSHTESDLVIFNGDHPAKDLYPPAENKEKYNLAFVPSKITKNSTKSFPIIYNSYNDGNSHLHTQTFNLPANSRQNEYNVFQEGGNSNLSDKQQNWREYLREETHKQNQFHTFQNIPSEGELPTAKFLSFPPANEHHFSSSQTEQYRPPEIHFEHRQPSPHNLIHQSSQQHNVIVQSRPASRVMQSPPPPLPSPRVINSVSPRRIVFEEPPPQRVLPDQRSIQISREEYEGYLQHIPHCRQMQQESHELRAQAALFSEKERGLWEESGALREENQRLRDLVWHLERREKELVREREERGLWLSEQISRYRESTLQQFLLLMERYRLETQRDK